MKANYNNSYFTFFGFASNLFPFEEFGYFEVLSIINVITVIKTLKQDDMSRGYSDRVPKCSICLYEI